MYGLTRGTMTLLGVAGAGFLLWLASQVESDSTGGYWTNVGLIAAAGLVLALSQLLGGWTKWGLPRISATVFLLGFVPALVAGGLVLLHAQPDASGLGSGWAGDLGVGGLADDLASVLPAIALALGLVLGFTLDTTGPLVDEEVEVEAEQGRADARPVPADSVAVDSRASDEPVAAERRELDRERVADDDRELVEDGDGTPRGRGLFRR